MHLLAAAHIIQLYFFDGHWIVKIGNRRVIERNMPIFTNSHKGNLGGCGIQQRPIAADFAVRVICAIDEMHTFKRNTVKDCLAQEMVE